MKVAVTIGERSMCARDKVGAVVVDAKNRIVDTGYNGPPAGYWLWANQRTTCESYCPRGQSGRLLAFGELDPAYDDCVSLHAEQNALMFSDRRLREGGKIYVSSGVCGTCAKLIANSGLSDVIMLERAGTEHRKTDKWCEFLEKCGITVVTLV